MLQRVLLFCCTLLRWGRAISWNICLTGALWLVPAVGQSRAAGVLGRSLLLLLLLWRLLLSDHARLGRCRQPDALTAVRQPGLSF